MVIALVAFVLHMAVLPLLFMVATHQGLDFYTTGSDSTSYVELAENLLSRGMLTRSSPQGMVIESFRTPGYPAFIAVVLFFFKSLVAVSLIQNVLMAFSVVLIYRIGLLFFSRFVSIGAAVFFFLEPAGLYISNQILSESVFTFLILLAIYIFLCDEEMFVQKAAFIGLLLAFATLVRPIAQFFPLLFIAFYIFRFRRKAFFAAAILFVSFSIVVFPWMYRNKRAYDLWFLSDVGVHNFYGYHVPMYLSYARGISERDARYIIDERLFEIKPNANPRFVTMRDSPAMARVAKEFILEAPISFSIFYAFKTLPFFVSEGVTDILRDLHLSQMDPGNASDLVVRGDINGVVSLFRRGDRITLIFLAGVFLWSIINLFCIFGLFRGVVLKGRTRVAVLVFCALILFFAVLSGPVSNARIRYPATPFFFLLAFFGLEVFFLTKVRSVDVIKSEG